MLGKAQMLLYANHGHGETIPLAMQDVKLQNCLPYQSRFLRCEAIQQRRCRFPHGASRTKLTHSCRQSYLTFILLLVE